MAAIKYFAFNNNGVFVDWSWRMAEFGLPLNGLEFEGGNGVDHLWVQAGSKADFRVAGGGADRLYLSGNFADYEQTRGGLDENGNPLDGFTYSFKRTFNGQQEVVLSMAMESMSERPGVPPAISSLCCIILASPVWSFK